MFSKLLSFLLTTSALLTSVSHAETTKRLSFVFFDAGETLALAPVLNLLREAGTNFTVLPLATSKTLLPDCKECLDLQKDCSVETVVDTKTPHDVLPFSEIELAKIQSCLNTDQVVLGAPSMAQYQIASALKNNGVKTIAYFDALSPVIEGSIGHQFMNLVQEFWVPSRLIEEAAQKLPHTSKLMTVGQPTLEVWGSTFARLSREEIMAALPELETNKRTLLFAGGYGKGYKESVRAFYESVSTLKDVQILLSAHPRMGDGLEKEILKNFPGLHVTFVPASVGTMKALFVSDLLISQNSTTGIQALFVDKPAVYLDPMMTGYSNFVLASGMSQMFTSAIGLYNFLIKDQWSFVQREDPYVLAGIPRNSAQLFFELLKR